MNLENEIAKVLKSRLATTDMINVTEVLSNELTDFQTAFNIALEMENRNLIKILYSNFNANKIVVEFTLLGKGAHV